MRRRRWARPLANGRDPALVGRHPRSHRSICYSELAAVVCGDPRTTDDRDLLRVVVLLIDIRRGVEEPAIWREGGALLLPIDSEHNAIFQCLPPSSASGREPAGVARRHGECHVAAEPGQAIGATDKICSRPIETQPSQSCFSCASFRRWRRPIPIDILSNCQLGMSPQAALPITITLP